MTFEGHSSEKKALGKSKYVSLCSSWKIIANGNDPFPIQKDGCSQEFFLSQEYTNIFLCWNIAIYNNIMLLDWELSIFYILSSYLKVYTCS